jgi:hypothetical protein
MNTLKAFSDYPQGLVPNPNFDISALDLRYCLIVMIKRREMKNDQTEPWRGKPLYICNYLNETKIFHTFSLMTTVYIWFDRRS